MIKERIPSSPPDAGWWRGYDVIITKIEENEKNIRIFCEIKQKEHRCISCGTATNTIHDYRMQTIKDIPAFGKLVTIALRKRRYRCPHCSKRFFENNSFLPKYHRMTVSPLSPRV